MSHSKSYDFLLKDISTLKRVGQKTKELLKKKKIETLFDVLWHLPRSFVDRSNLINIDKLEIGKICTIKVQVKKYNIPRIRNLPNTVKCEDLTGQISIVFFIILGLETIFFLWIYSFELTQQGALRVSALSVVV